MLTVASKTSAVPLIVTGEVTVAPRAGSVTSIGPGGPWSTGVLVGSEVGVGSVVAVGEARTLLVSASAEVEKTNDTSAYPDDDWDNDYAVDDGFGDPFRNDEELR